MEHYCCSDAALTGRHTRTIDLSPHLKDNAEESRKLDRTEYTGYSDISEHYSMRVIAAVNQKGGSGKTTTAVNVAACLAECGRKVLVVDLDPQANATSWLDVQYSGPGILELLQGAKAQGLTQETNTPGVSIIPSSDWLINAESEISKAKNPANVLNAGLQKIPAKQYDYILLDCPPALGMLTLNALTAAGEVLITVEAHAMALNGVAKLLQTIGKIQGGPNPNLQIGGILACRVTRTRHATQVVEKLRAFFPKQMYNTVIRENVKLAEASSFAQPITTYDPTSNGADDYRSLTSEIIAQEK
jgi:chromosome partitioning protein